MRTTISARGFSRKTLERDIRRYARHMLGRLRRPITHAELALKEEDAEPVGGMHVCTLRLRLRGSADVVVLARGAGKIAALTSAFRWARYELMRRRAAKRLPSTAWQDQVQAASG
ncbi:hypothetical protein ACFL1S_06640 [Pseudomonadota bacterium]